MFRDSNLSQRNHHLTKSHGHSIIQSLIVVLAVLAALCVGAANSFAAANTSQMAVHAYSTGNVTTSAYTELVASTSISVGKLEVCDTSGKLLKIASGASGSEVDILTTTVSGCVIVPYYLAKGTRLSIEAIDANATSGYNTVSLIP